MADSSPDIARPVDVTRVQVPRHALATRITHWINVLAFLMLLGSGLAIFNSHSALYWGQSSRFADPWLSMTAEPGPKGALRGKTTLFGAKFDTTGLLGASDAPGPRGIERRGFPKWTTIPSYRSLADGRRWHFFFAWLLVLNGLAYLILGLWNRHIQNDLKVTKADLKTIPHEIVEHARFRFPKGEEARRYNVLQKLTYGAVIFVIFPLLILAGLTMSPGVDSAFHLPVLFGGRQSARSVHFLMAFALVGFLAIHLIMVVASGTWNNIRSMITGRYAIEVPEGNAVQEGAHGEH